MSRRGRGPATPARSGPPPAPQPPAARPPPARTPHCQASRRDGQPGAPTPWRTGVGSHRRGRHDDVLVQLGEPRLVEPAGHVLGLEVLHRVVRRPASVEVGGYALGEVAEVDELPQLGVAAVDRLEDRRPPAGPQHAKELPRGLRLSAHVDEHRPGRHDVHRIIRQRQHLRIADEIRDARILTVRAQLFEAVDRDVERDHRALGAESVERAEHEQTRARAHVEDRVVLFEPRAVEHPLAGLLERRDRVVTLARRHGFEARLHEPFGPDVPLLRQFRKNWK